MKITKAQLKKLIKEELDTTMEELEGKRMVYVVFENTADDASSGGGERSIDAIFDSKEKAVAYIEDYYPSERDREVHTSQIIEEHELE